MSNKLISSFTESINIINQNVLGKQQQIELIFIALLSKGHVLLNDIPGVGKTTLAKSMAMVLGMDFGRIQFTSDLMPSDITGFSMPNSLNERELVFQKGPIFNNIVLADEINRASPRTQSAMLEAMDEYQVTLDNSVYPLPNPFWVIATQNPVDFSGTFPLPQSQMDRFLFQIELGYPGKENEIDMFLGKHKQKNITSVLSISKLLEAQKLISEISFSPSVANYLYSLIDKTRNHNDFSVGLSPRSALSMISASRASAWLSSRKFVIPEDIQKIFIPASIHRIHSNRMDRGWKEDILKDILKSTPYVK